MNLLNTWNSLFVLFVLVPTSMSLIPSLDSVEIIKNSQSDVGSCPHCTNSVEVYINSLQPRYYLMIDMLTYLSCTLGGIEKNMK